MVQLEILTGKRAGEKIEARHFPFIVGREPGLDLTLEEPGVWGRHLELRLAPQHGIVLAVLSEALVSVNAQPVREHRLRNGDTIEIGALKIRFWLAETRPRSFRLRERLIWIGLAAVFLLQIAIIYWLGN